MVQNLSRVSQAEQLLLHQFKRVEGSNLKKLLQMITTQNQEFENALYDVYINNSLDLAVGVNLDAIGEIVGEARTGSDTDSTYRARIKLRTVLNRSNGTVENIISAVMVYAITGSALQVTMFSACIFIHFTTTYDINPLEMALIQATAPAGVNVALVVNDELDWFEFGSGTTIVADTTYGFADWTGSGMTVGGKMGQLIL